MSFILTLLLLVIMFAAVALLYNNGMWSNGIRLINLVTAALLAMNYFEPLAKWLDGMSPSLTYFWDFVSVWILFVIFMIVFQKLTGMVSKVKVRFLGVVDRVGSVGLAVAVGWVLICFTLTTLHTAPLSRSFLFGGFRSGESMFLGMAPDQQWLGFMQRQSKGSFSRSLGESDQVAVFDPDGRFIAKYAERRSALQRNIDAGAGVKASAGSTPSR